MKHALVIGGTGMLAEVCLWLTVQDYHVSVIGRNPHKMSALTDKAENGKITALLVDYKEVDKLDSLLHQTIQHNGPVDLVVAWVHTGGEPALDKITKTIAETSGVLELYHVLGSRAHLSEVKSAMHIPITCSYHQIQLGFKLEGNQGRWLRNKEIADGVIEAIQNQAQTSLVGVLEPKEMRP
ncbi:hypothetical protein AB685_17870 [Bacillus sp. LL01]|uniref:short-chain dehydrogenase n=1 Tax=Bacillus sp. LL01 TaxID=1665556 RepID=UPI00064CF242|nr:short-chain dehydrogenase [Bacillus sp. LL01]KMJ57266.1 hypothetical protein AB685_17870 [Bacillus sp. LL01]